MPSYKSKSRHEQTPKHVPRPITAGDFIEALALLKPSEYGLPIMVGMDDEHEFLMVTVSNSFDKPIVKLLTSENAPEDERIRIIRV